MSGSIPLRQFIRDSGDVGPVVGILESQRLPRSVPGITARTLDGSMMTTVSGLLDEFTRRWDLAKTAGRNRDALDDAMRDLDGPAVSAGRPTPDGYLTRIVHADAILTSAPDELGWFAESLVFYRDHYRDHTRPAASFGVLLLTLPTLRESVADRWRAVGVTPAEVTG
ncbi:barstar family protein [Gordonia soli]|uniref:Barstar (barnase inhibitor) domain-containing protein n=1 Tax=Gordonia soli NBRC 108243 TaxID=1223545 RepID=M0QP38_9ACTN|nr:barstar family protein [Gordonia soli]GAC70041.1 hypothetical protein GS4_31_00070 [Gordonia soli NBRC 108243]